jgi:hypothetical protein
MTHDQPGDSGQFARYRLSPVATALGRLLAHPLGLKAEGPGLAALSAPADPVLADRYGKHHGPPCRAKLVNWPPAEISVTSPLRGKAVTGKMIRLQLAQ